MSSSKRQMASLVCYLVSLCCCRTSSAPSTNPTKSLASSSFTNPVSPSSILRRFPSKTIPILLREISSQLMKNSLTQVDLTLIVLSNCNKISVHNIGGLLMSFDQHYWNKINQYNYIEHGIGLLDADGRLAQTSFTFVDDEGSRKKMEEYADRKQQLGKDLTQLRNAVRASYATGYLTDVFYRAVSKGKLQRNKRHRRKEEKMVQDLSFNILTSDLPESFSSFSSITSMYLQNK
ncbi:hypothetical protein LWI29_009164 [Acer saccharum]|uniref:Uncharacterized protein n=1 Tax=Acer saccharum TaxID=4024 RepID=A0AA39SS46_ACESA|nr:hypothetical protein LWI29_009164 [Acer saccharum]